ncbi:hypothetical protein SBV1_2030009 [Verrucomicrobia bacterium]|nr:hypothetical protein SBV1_2030009 [Verrucomicrobiota bacterium]
MGVVRATTAQRLTNLILAINLSPGFSYVKHHWNAWNAFITSEWLSRQGGFSTSRFDPDLTFDPMSGLEPNESA